MRNSFLAGSAVAIALHATGPAVAHSNSQAESPQTAAQSTSPTASQAPSPSPSAKPSDATADPACDAAAKAKLNVGALSVADVCKTVVDDFKARPEVQDPPRYYTLSVENKAFVDQLRASLHQVRKKRYGVVIIDFALGFIKTEKSLRTAVEPNYTESTLGVWLDRINDHKGIYRLQSAEAQSLSPEGIIFEWVGKPVINWLIKTFFRKDPYGDAKKVDAYVVNYASGANKDSIKSICFVPTGTKIDDGICPR